MIDWGDEEKPRPHGGMVGLDVILKDARRGDVQAVKGHLKRDPSLLLAMSGGHNRTFLWEAVRGNQLELTRFLLTAGADPNVPGRIRAEIPLLLKPYCISRFRKAVDLAKMLEPVTDLDIFSVCFLGDSDRAEQLLEQDSSLVSAEQADDSVWRVTPLHFAVAGGHEQLVRRLIESGAQVRTYTRLLCNTAARMKHPELLPILRDAGADSDLMDEWSKLRPQSD